MKVEYYRAKDGALGNTKDTLSSLDLRSSVKEVCPLGKVAGKPFQGMAWRSRTGIVFLNTAS